jgi:peptidoglycan/LPS O-acetylase OafA/YrhL
MLLSERASERNFPLDVLRVIAISVVFIFHLPNLGERSIYGGWDRVGWIGVELFFVLSGYLIGYQILKRVCVDRFTYRSFYASRLLRTLPVYLFALGLYVFLPGFRERPNLQPAWKFLTFTQNFDLPMSAFSHAWSLCIEEQFYLVAPLTILILWRVKQWRALVWSFFASVIVFGLLYRHFEWVEYSKHATEDLKWDLFVTEIYYPTWGRLDGLLCGVGVAALKFNRNTWNFISTKRNLLFAMGGIGLALSIYMFLDRLSWIATVFGYPLLSMSFACFVAGALTIERKPHNSFGLSYLAILSYSFYLIHKMVIHFIDTRWTLGAGVSSQLLFAAACFLASTAAAYLMYQIIERPFLKLRSRLLKAIT